MMKIECVADKPDRAGRYLIRFEDGSVMRLYRQTVEDHGLCAGLVLSQTEMSDLRRDAGAMSAKMRAVRITAAASVSRQDLQERLVRKGESPEQAREAVDWMAGLHLVDDRQTAAQVVSHCAARGYGISRARQALYEKKIPKEFWEDALADYPDQQEHILAFLRSRLDENADSKDVKRAVDALLRRGHSYGEIRKALERIVLDTENFPEE